MPAPSVSSQELHTSKLLRHFLEKHTGERVYFRDLLDNIGDVSPGGESVHSRVFAFVLLLCALPEALPLPIAGVSTIIGIPLIIVSAQLFLGFNKPWLPAWIADRSMKRNQFAKFLHKILPTLEKFESLIRPRWKFVTVPIAQRIFGLLFLILAIVIALPIPFGNLPPAIAIVIISLGMIEQDGVVIILGALGACLVLGIMASAIAAFFSIVITFFTRQFN